MVRLRTGEEVIALVALEIFDRLKELLSEMPIAFLELVTACRNPEHVPFKRYVPILKKKGLIEDVFDNGRVHMTPMIRQIVLASVEGNKIENMYLVSPLAKS